MIEVSVLPQIQLFEKLFSTLTHSKIANTTMFSVNWWWNMDKEVGRHNFNKIHLFSFQIDLYNNTVKENDDRFFDLNESD